MKRNQFFYYRTLEGTDTVVLDSFNIENVIRTVALEDGRRLVLLNDIHERSVEVPDINPTTNKMKGTKRERNTYQSEIYLNAEDSELYGSLTTIRE